MVAACEAREVDLVITKSISRFARNTIDCLNYIRQLQALGQILAQSPEPFHPIAPFLQSIFMSAAIA